MLSFVKLHVNQISFNNRRSKSSAVILNFQISQGNVAMHLKWGGNMYHKHTKNVLEESAH